MSINTRYLVGGEFPNGERNHHCAYSKRAAALSVAQGLVRFRGYAVASVFDSMARAGAVDLWLVAPDGSVVPAHKRGGDLATVFPWPQRSECAR